MKRLLFPIALFALFSLSACAPLTKPATPPTPPTPTTEPGSIEGSAPVTFAPSDGQKACTKEYAPVCGKFQVQCIKAPCPPIDTTYSNRCVAENAGATDITEGACGDKTAIEDKPAATNGISDHGTDCISNQGIWLFQSNECEGIDKATCEKIGGTFNECASACRNDPKAEVCTMQCVIICQFPKI